MQKTLQTLCRAY